MLRREYHCWHSPHLDRRMELLVFGDRGARVLVFPTRAGRFYDFEDWRLVAALRPMIEQGWIQLFCIDSVDAESFYCNWAHPSGRVRRHLQYEAYVLQEVLPFTRHRNPNPFMTALGCSLGGYHAVNLALRHPQWFGRVVALSGRYDLTQAVGSFRDLLDGHYSDDVYFNMPCHYLPNLAEGPQLDLIRRLDVRLMIGEHDAFHGNNRYLHDVLQAKGVRQLRLLEWAGDEAHRAYYWRRVLPDLV